MKKNSLLIISDTPMWGKENSKFFVFEPTLREVERLADLFEVVYWIGYRHGLEPELLARSPLKPHIKVIMLPYAVGGNRFYHKLKILPFLPKMMITVVKNIKLNSVIHTRGPSVPALIAILFSFFDRSRIYWHKYAGNWRQNHAPLAYAVQRSLLRRNLHQITVNGNWSGERANIINLENPCFTREEIQLAKDTVRSKSPGNLITICFVGALVPAKGVNGLMKALAKVAHIEKIDCVLIVGDGAERKQLEGESKHLPFQIKFLGNLLRDQVNEVYAQSDIIVLPSKSEGFPKVIAEAAAFGCVPIVSNVSAISQYIIHGENGLLLENTDPSTIAKSIDSILTDFSKLRKMQTKVMEMAEDFTYERFVERVKNEILKT